MRARGMRGLLAPLVAVVVSLAMCAGANAAFFASTADDAGHSTGGTALSLRVDGTPADPDDPTFTGNDTNLRIMLAAEEAEEVTVTFMHHEGSVYTSWTTAQGSKVSPPDNAPVWPQEAGSAPRTFVRWCAGTQEAPDYTREWDFDEPVYASVWIWAEWSEAEPVDVVLRANGEGAAFAEPDSADAPDTVTVSRYPGLAYGLLPEPERKGYTFAHWSFAGGACADDGEGATDAIDLAVSKVPDAAAAPDGSRVAVTLYAHWRPNTYWVSYYANNGRGGKVDVAVEYDSDATVLDWPAVVALAAGQTSQEGLWDPKVDSAFDEGWTTEPAGGTYWKAGSALPDLAEFSDGTLRLYARWVDHWDIDPGPFDVVFMTNDGSGAGGAGAVWRDFTEAAGTAVEKGGRIAKEQVPDPKRIGYQFSCWRVGTVGEDGAVTLGREWKFDENVLSDLTLYAEWTLRLDVTLPVEVGFAVDAESREVTTPEADLYAIKSRTVAPVQVEEMAVISRDDELEGFFDLGEDAEGWQSALQDTALWVWRTGPGGASAWTTDFSKEPDGAGGLSFALPLANAAGERGEYVRVGPDGTPGERIEGWRNAVSLAGNDKFRLEAFSYAGTAFDEGWQGGDPSVSLPLKLGMGISGDLEVETALDGPKPLTHLIVTVSARG